MTTPNDDSWPHPNAPADGASATGKPAAPRAPSPAPRRSLWDDGEVEGNPFESTHSPPSTADAPEAVDPSEPPDEPPDGPPPPRRRPERRKMPVGTWLRNGLLGLVGLGIVALVLSLGPLLKDNEVVELNVDGRLALLPLVNETGSEAYDWMAEGWTEMVAQTLSRTPGVIVIPPQRLAREVKLRGLAREQDVARERIRALAHAMGAELVLEGVVRRRGIRRDELRPLSGGGEPALRLDFRLLDVDGRAVTTAELRGNDPIELANRLVVSLARGLSADGEPVRLEHVYSSNVFLDELYGLGLTALRRQDFQQAESVFQLVLQQDPHFLWAGVGLLEARLTQPECSGCRELAQDLLARAQVTSERRVEASVLKVLARLEALAGRAPAARELFSQARSVLPEEASNAHLQVDSELSRLALVSGDRDAAKALFDQQLIAERTLGNVLGQASILLELGSLELSRGEMEAARNALERALQLAREHSDPWLEARAVSSLGEVARQQGDAARAMQLWQEALAFYRHPEDRQRRLLLLSNLSQMALQERRFDEAEDYLYAARDLAAELEAYETEATSSLRLAWVMLRTGYPRQAREHLDRTLELDRWITTERLALQRVIAWFAYEEGNFRLAVETQEEVRMQAVDTWRPIDDAFLSAYRRALAGGVRVPVPGEGEAGNA